MAAVGKLYQNAHRFLHSFILNIYIATLQENYSEAAPNTSTVKQSSLKVRKNAGAQWFC